MSGQVDLSVCREGDLCELRNGESHIFEGPNEGWFGKTHPYRSNCGSHRGDGTTHWDETIPDWPYDVVRVFRDGVQITPAVEPGSILKDKESMSKNAGPLAKVSLYRTGETPLLKDRVRFHGGDSCPSGYADVMGLAGVIVGLRDDDDTVAVEFDGGRKRYAYPMRFNLISRVEDLPPSPPESVKHSLKASNGNEHTAAGELRATVPVSSLRDREAEPEGVPELREPWSDGATASAPSASEVAALRDALWVCMEHNRLHHGPNHNTVIQAEEALSGWTPKHRIHPQNPIAESGPAAILKSIRDAVLENNGLQDAPAAAAVITGPDCRIKHLTQLLSEATVFIETPNPELGSDEWVWLIQASAAVHNQCVKCSAPCDVEGDCVNPECCFGRSKLAQVDAAAVK